MTVDLGPLLVLNATALRARVLVWIRTLSFYWHLHMSHTPILLQLHDPDPAEPEAT